MIYKKYLKRVLDISVSILMLPIIILLSLIILPFTYFSDRGPLFYNAERRGLNGKVFKMYKFRSMHVNAPDIRNDDNSTYNSENDSRVTRVGHILRKTSLDEVPQFLNVLKGDMSLVGPRPNLTSKPLEDLDENEWKRIRVRPGITGYNQAFYRNLISKEEKYMNDIYYVDHISLFLDAKIIIHTFKTVLLRKNIYTNSTKGKTESG